MDRVEQELKEARLIGQTVVPDNPILAQEKLRYATAHFNRVISILQSAEADLVQAEAEAYPNTKGSVEERRHQLAKAVHEHQALRDRAAGVAVGLQETINTCKVIIRAAEADRRTAGA